MDRISKFMIPENDDPLRSHDYQETIQLAQEEVQDLIQHEKESKELYMINKSLSEELKGTLI